MSTSLDGNGKNGTATTIIVGSSSLLFAIGYVWQASKNPEGPYVCLAVAAIMAAIPLILAMIAGLIYLLRSFTNNKNHKCGAKKTQVPSLFADGYFFVNSSESEKSKTKIRSKPIKKQTPRERRRRQRHNRHRSRRHQ